MMEEIRALINSHSSNATAPGEVFDVIWANSDGVPWRPYSIDRQVAEDLSKNIRNQLRELVRHAQKEGAQKCGHLLKDLARKGLELRDAVFATGRNMADQTQAGRIKDWLATLDSRQTRMFFRVGAKTHIPWGLIYDGDPEALSGDPEDVAIEHYQDFWCLKYRLCSMFEQIEASATKVARAPDELELIPVVDKDTINKLARLSPDSDRQVWDGLVKAWSRRTEPEYSSVSFFDRWKKLPPRIGLVYFLCHADGANLALSVEDRIDLTKLKTKLSRAPKDILGSTAMVFLNGCSTAWGDDAKGGFLEATGSEYCCGFIGTEAEIPDVFAFRFGTAFLNALLTTGDPVFTVMDRMRRQHWPISVLYSVCCWPQFKVAPSAVTAPIDAVLNLSAEALGERVM